MTIALGACYFLNFAFELIYKYKHVGDYSKGSGIDEIAQGCQIWYEVSIFQLSGTIMQHMLNCDQESRDSANQRVAFHQREVVAKYKGLHPLVSRSPG